MLKQTQTQAHSQRVGNSRGGSQGLLSLATWRSPVGARAVERAARPVRASRCRALGRLDAPQTSPPCRPHALQHLRLDHSQSHGTDGCARCADKMGPARAGGVCISLSWIPCERRPCACCPVHSKDDGGPKWPGYRTGRASAGQSEDDVSALRRPGDHGRSGSGCVCFGRLPSAPSAACAAVRCDGPRARERRRRSRAGEFAMLTAIAASWTLSLEPDRAEDSASGAWRAVGLMLLRQLEWGYWPRS